MRGSRTACGSESFREDLYYRLNVLGLRLPPLRERLEDIPDLVRHFVARLANRYGARKRLSESAVQALCRYDWPGNVRELENRVHRAYVLSAGAEITCADLEMPEFGDPSESVGAAASDGCGTFAAAKAQAVANSNSRISGA